MTELQMAKEILSVTELNLEEFEDNLAMFSFLNNVDEMDVISLRGDNTPLWALEFKPLLEKAVSSLECDVYSGTNYNLEEFSVFLDILVHDTINSGKFNKENKVVYLPSTKEPENYVEGEMESIPTKTLEGRGIENYYKSIVGAIRGYENLDKETDGKKAEGSTTSEVENKVDEELEGWETFIDNQIRTVLAVYSEIYEGGFFLRPYGLLVDRGFITAKGYKKEKTVEVLFKILNENSEGVFSLNGEYEHNLIPSLANIKKGIRYYPHFQLNMAFGLLGGKQYKNYSEFEGKLYDVLFKVFSREILNMGMNLDEVSEQNMRGYLKPLVEALTTTIVIAEYNPGNSIMIKTYAPTSGFAQSTIENAIKSGKLFNLNSSVPYFAFNESLGTTLFSIALSENGSGQPLFAFEALDTFKENGTKVSWSNIFLGRRVDNRPLFRDFSREFANVIVAGSGSGKGVMTLNILAAAVGSGYPIFYLDGKPEMSETLWSIANSGGYETFAFDCLHRISDKRTFDPEYDIASIPAELKKHLGDETERLVHTMSYLRGLELMCKIAVERGSVSKDKSLTKEEKKQEMEKLGGERLVFVVDEFEVFNESVNKLLTKIDTLYKSITAGLTQKQKDEYADILKYKNNFSLYVQEVTSQIGQGYQATFRVADISIFFIFQHCNVGKTFPDSAMINKLRSDLSGGSVRLFGRGVDSGEGSEVFGTAKLSSVSKGLINDRYFAISKGTSDKFIEGAVDVFKPYLVLNEATDTYCNKIVGINTDASLRAKVTDESGNWKKEIGFQGYAEALLNIDIRPVLNRSWLVAQYVLKKNGLSDNIFEYMYDVHNFGSLSSRAKNNTSKVDYGEEYSEGKDGIEKSHEDVVFGFESSPLNQENFEIDTPDQQEEGNTSDTNDIQLDTEDISSTQEVSETGQSEGNKDLFSQQQDTDRSEIDQNKGIFNFNGKKVEPAVFNDFIFAKNQFNLTEQSFMDEQSMVDSLNNLSMVLYAQINECIGESRVTSLLVKDRYIICNNVRISPSITKEIAERLPYDIRADVSSGRYAEVFCFMLTKHFSNLTSMSFDDVDFFTLKVMNDYNLSCRGTEATRRSLIKIFDINRSLRTLTVGRDTYTIDTLYDNKKSFSDDMKSANRAREIEGVTRTALPERSSSGIMGFYRNQNIGTGAKIATTVGVGALTALALTNPIGTLAVGVTVGKSVANGTKGVFGRLKSGFKAFGQAFKDSL